MKSKRRPPHPPGRSNTAKGDSTPGSAAAHLRCTRDFQNYIYRKSNGDIFDHSPDPSTSICGIKHDSDTLLVLPRTTKLSNVSYYGSLDFVQFNNYAVGDRELEILRKNRENLSSVTTLCFWNAGITDLASLEFFPNVRHLYLAHVLKAGFSFAGLDHLRLLETLCLLKTPKLADLRFLEHVSCDRLANLSVENARNLKSTAGIERLDRLRYFNLVGAESTYRMDSLAGLDLLPCLAEVDLFNVFVPPRELATALKGASHPVKLKMSPNLYEARVYKMLGSQLGHVDSSVFHAYIQQETRIVPVGKGKRVFDTSDPRATEKRERLQAEWDEA